MSLNDESINDESEQPEQSLSDQIAEIKKGIAELQNQYDSTENDFLSLKAQDDNFNETKEKLYEEFQANINAINEEQNKVQAELSVFTQQRRQLENYLSKYSKQLEDLTAEAERQAREEARQEHLDALAKQWDIRTMAAPWREWAKEHQIHAGHYITANQKVLLGDQMGLGKTLSSIIMCDMAEAATRNTNKDWPFMGEEHEDGSITDAIYRPVGKKIIYFCPSSLIRNVEKEFRMWSPHRSVTYVGNMDKGARDFAFQYALKDRAEFVVICNYEAFHRDKDLMQNFVELDPDTVIIDEAHNIKNLDSIAYKSIKNLLFKAQPEYVIPMTGTPILNRPEELFSLLTLVLPNQFYHLNDFLFKFCRQDNYTGKWYFRDSGLQSIKNQISSNFLMRTKDQAGIELPEQTITDHDLDIDTVNYPEQQRIREQLRTYATIMIDEAEGEAIPITAMIAMFTRLRQVETFPQGIELKDKETGEVKLKVDVDESQKLDYIFDNNGDGLMSEFIESERAVVFSQFKAPLHELKRRLELQGYSAVVLDGDASNTLRDEVNTDFDPRYTQNGEHKYDVALCNYRVGGVGLNLLGATQMVILDEEWNPGKRNQAYARINRIGQTKETSVHVIRVNKTIDDWQRNIMKQKEGMVDGFNDTMLDVTDVKDALDSGLI